MKAIVSVVSLLALFTTPAYAQRAEDPRVQYAAAWSDASPVNDLQVVGGNIVIGRMTWITLACGNSSYKVSPDMDTASRDRLVHVLMTAQIEGRQVRVWQNGSCESGRTLIGGVRLVD